MARTSAETADVEPPKTAATALVRKLQNVVGRVAEADRLVQRANVREALTRTELTLALCEALTGRAEALRVARDRAVDAYRRAAAARARPRRRTPRDRRIERLALRMRWLGEALIIARSGLWRPSGQTLRSRLSDFARMARYARRGADPQAAPSTVFDQAWYLETYPDLAATRTSPLFHYLLAGGEEDRTPHPLFDPVFYRERNAAELAATDLTPLEHFMRVGAAEGRDPHPLFSIAHYVGNNPDAAEGENPLAHYLDVGWTRDYSPHPLFDAAWYRQRARGAGADQAPLVHYLLAGSAEGLRPHPLFDPLWYLRRYPDVEAAKIEPLIHFVLAGAADRRDPSPWFDVAHYLSIRGDRPVYDDNPLVDYLAGGAWRVGEARPGFTSMAYLTANLELVRQGVTPLEHWARFEEG